MRGTEVFNEEGMIVKAGGLVKLDDKILLVSSNNKDFVIPKGHLEKGEEIRDCAIREVSEETGLDLKIIKDLTPIEYLNPRINKKVKLYYYLFSGEGQEKPEPGTYLNWFGLDEALKADPYENEKEIIKEAFK